MGIFPAGFPSGQPVMNFETDPGLPVSDNTVAPTVAAVKGYIDNNISKVQGAGSTVMGGAWGIFRKSTTNGSGVATIYLTTDGTSGTAAAFSSSVMEDGVSITPIGTANYNVTAATVSGDRKSISVTLNQIKTILGLLTFNATADAGVEVRVGVWGK